MLSSPSFPTTSKLIFAKYPVPLAVVSPESSDITFIVSESMNFHLLMGIGVSSICPPLTFDTFTTFESKARSNIPILKSIMLSTSMVITKVSPSSTHSGVLTSTLTVGSSSSSSSTPTLILASIHSAGISSAVLLPRRLFSRSNMHSSPSSPFTLKLIFAK